ncbi:fam-c protein [Plasmodium berghei]|uniref:Fam-c protein n=2 Tax=Plasmodium berghei TaxID=5821 RepID=A0A509AEH9_PLABA|nr:fam-c protein [Plasmodium berghei ANKA]CXH85198.1 fam-c protein [Plasmodium berghei]SBW38199.1 fam-c protein [Plasmodium berghei]SCL82620.1 fam-c protein [Plasmodium berghei]SCL83819.1 fam-c protein [Plasmodium berghei]SCL83961.1 fam-c protein [Plasmodium berghei]|eukprot:XP_034419740.1 fam-c protein [Plasmodium berghei ANKA]
MNKRIFSLVCIALYVIFIVPTHCSEQEVSDAGNKSFSGIEEINRNDENNDIEYKHETQLKNNNPKEDNDKKKKNNKNKKKNSDDYEFFPMARSTRDEFLSTYLRMRYRT